MKRKNIGYAYAMSDIASANGFARTGCYFLAVYDDNDYMQTKDVIIACKDKEVIKAEAERINLKYATHSLFNVMPSDKEV